MARTQESAVARWRRDKDRYFESSPDAPVEGPFAGLTYYPEDGAYAVEALLEPFDPPQTVWLTTSAGDAQPYRRYGRATFTLAGRTLQLTLFVPAHLASGEPERFFIPFRDATSGTETYGAGRYLEAGAATGGRVTLDFNYAYHPFCAYSARYRCPLPPAENHLGVPIRAGERLPDAPREG
ncbi:DUF1684 domain-containing protein [Truepera radiovictrix]|uniref:DUF1684 domain-containing protein n=1 Tax=Truepera radiovictrix (strain DSM 17093 / CIP 108686 / LMG 22925 / RQ-24) TaxID=649638 RepID=D7CR60_TRURR|nr:DUF1684 domain-containing protein [Truepera radiovictrix]ADI15148.1 protein of unknown function DUF1684 [Truepera radiovictrix DSM 17093]WMT56299.1 DUF1684 domain-containing protein [Truepera radiovictrix]